MYILICGIPLQLDTNKDIHSLSWQNLFQVQFRFFFTFKIGFYVFPYTKSVPILTRITRAMFSLECPQERGVGLLYFLWIKLAKGQLSMPYHISIIVRYNLNSPIYKKCIMPNFKSLVCWGYIHQIIIKSKYKYNYSPNIIDPP